MLKECQMEELWRKRLRISEKEKGLLEIQERDGWTMLKTVWRRRVLEAGSK